ncbi:MAG TPA: FkbM family methyltransferase [Lacibacter sp.]|nr:FkbM family methyltransferase [Lacibacter sp.]HMP85643.1 FkbM family methyltransferase [Lacibacter sp.]
MTLQPLKSLIRKFKLPQPLHKKSFSQCGEDMIAGFYLKGKKGFYIDVGAFHPKRISNTYYFYQKGWCGINIDGSNKSIDLFRKYRPKDINIHACVGMCEIDTEVNFYLFNTPELNTFDKASLGRIEMYHNQKPIGIAKVPLRSLKSLLNEFLPKGQEIDLLTVDAEGADEDVLRSNDWQKYRPSVVIVENHCSVGDFLQSGMYKYLSEMNYVIGGHSRHSYVFCDVLKFGY